MIGKLKGIIDTIETASVLIDVAGVGYEVFCSGATLRQIGAEGEATTLHIETHVREDHIHLYGFYSASEKQSFQTLTKVSGVGAKMALAILTVLSPSQLAAAIAAQDKASFTPVSGVGPKLANRLVTELKDKFSVVTAQETLSASPASLAQNNDIADAVTALTGLGYSRSDAFAVVTKVAAQNDNAPIDTLIKEGLKELSSA